MGVFSNLFGGGNGKIQVYLQNGAVVIDVRTPGEYQSGHVKGSRNIPLQNIESQLNQIKNIKAPLVLCCASGMRSGQATRFLKNEGLDCVNGGSWTKVNALMTHKED